MLRMEVEDNRGDAVYSQFNIEQTHAQVLESAGLFPIEDPLEGAIDKYYMLLRFGTAVQEDHGGEDKLKIDFSNIKPNPKSLRESIAQKFEPVTAVFYYNGELYNWVLNGQYDLNNNHFDLSNVLITPSSLKDAWERPIK